MLDAAVAPNAEARMELRVRSPSCACSPWEYREPLMLAAGGLSHDEIARVLVSVKTAKVRVHRARGVQFLVRAGTPGSSGPSGVSPRRPGSPSMSCTSGPAALVCSGSARVRLLMPVRGECVAESRSRPGASPATERKPATSASRR